jgi:hypothetical protein
MELELSNIRCEDTRICVLFHGVQKQVCKKGGKMTSRPKLGFESELEVLDHRDVMESVVSMFRVGDSFFIKPKNGGVAFLQHNF